MSIYEDEDGIDGPANKAWDAAMKEDAESMSDYEFDGPAAKGLAALEEMATHVLSRIEALEAKCALLSASLKKADARAEALEVKRTLLTACLKHANARAEAAETKLAELVRRVHAYASLLEEGWSLHAVAEDFRPEVKP